MLMTMAHSWENTDELQTWMEAGEAISSRPAPKADETLASKDKSGVIRYLEGFTKCPSEKSKDGFHCWHYQIETKRDYCCNCGLNLLVED
jgi:hypothetical protein